VLDMTRLICFALYKAVRVTAEALNDSDGTIQLMAQLKHTLTSLIPKGEADLPQFTKTLEKACVDFESKMVSFGWIPPIPPAPTPLDAGGESSSGASATAGIGSHMNGPLTSIVSDLTSKFADARFDSLCLTLTLIPMHQ
jgi:hypothetical protein